MKKLFLLFISLLSIVVLASCSNTKGSMEELIGTYKLTKYIIQEYSETEDKNMIEEEEITAYLVVNNDGFGYYVFKSSKVETTIKPVTIEYSYHSEETDKITYIEYTSGENDTSIYKSRPGYFNEVSLAFNPTGQILSYSQSKLKIGKAESPRLSVSYTKISDDVTLGAVETDLNTKFSLQPHYLLKNLNGIFVYKESIQDNTRYKNNIVDYGKYKYLVVDINNITEKANIYYMLNEDDGEIKKNTDQELLNQSINFTVDGYSGSLSIMGKTYSLSLGTNKCAPYGLYNSYFSDEYTDENNQLIKSQTASDSFEKQYSGTIEEIIQNQKTK